MVLAQSVRFDVGAIDGQLFTAGQTSILNKWQATLGINPWGGRVIHVGIAT
jgi:hypothetical protein